MEIGVLDGENAKTLINVASENLPAEEVEYYGFDFFSGSRFSQVNEKLKTTGCRFQLFKGDTMDTLPKAIKTLPKMDLIFIDGGKSYSEAESDWTSSETLMHDGTAVFVHNINFSGVQKMVNSISREKYKIKIIHSSSDSDTARIEKKI